MRMSRLLSLRFALLAPTLLVALLLSSCKADVPEGILSEDEMEDVLFDYHTAIALARDGRDSTVADKARYTESVFRKYHITQGDFDRSVTWYTRHSDLLFTIYKRLDERFAAATDAAPVTSQPLADRASGRDTVNLWQAPSFALLSTQGRRNLSFAIEADSSFHAGDSYRLQFTPAYYYSEGARLVIARLLLRYEGDSVVAQHQYTYGTGERMVIVKAPNTKRRLLSIEGFVMQQADCADKPKIVTLSDIALVRMRGKAEEVKSVVTGAPTGLDSLRAQTPAQRLAARQKQLRDSMNRQEAAREASPHFAPIDNAQAKPIEGARPRRMRLGVMHKQ